VNSSQNSFRVIDIDLSKNGETQNAHGFLAVYKKNDSRISLVLDPGDEALSRRLDIALLENWLERR
jgi:hypothetical protein